MFLYHLRYEFPIKDENDEIVRHDRTVGIRALDDRTAMRLAKVYVSRQEFVHNGETQKAKMLLVSKTTIIYQAPENSSPLKT